MHKNTLILIVEDEDEIADILMSYLERSGMKTLRARQGEQAITLNRLHKPDLILLDIHLPVCDGWSVLTTLRQESSVPVIMVSALDQDVDKLMGLRLGADDYVIKPFNPSEVVARVEAVLRRTKLRFSRRVLCRSERPLLRSIRMISTWKSPWAKRSSPRY
ncbi:two component transcriptional regulator [Enterobacter asburiae]|uniref:Two component transcriptional regulator n=1 Tax=Enterobacter asburiae TaxID=61645 RepID=A0A376FC40_ENTAS|nr:two component transcriptional regulator [Enterobacter asburiae]